MIPDLRARIRAAAEKPREAPALRECMCIEARTPLSELPGLLSVDPSQVRRLGLDHPGFDVQKTLFVDTETTGLHGAGTVAFLVGMGFVEGDAFIVRQLLMRDYPEETHLLERLAGMLSGFNAIISFNGKSFDMPLLAGRFLLARLPVRWHEMPHLDLLHAARRTWKLRLSSCSLGRLEAEELGIAREQDLPSAEVPERYFRYLKTGDFSLLDDVLSHNRQDIVTLAALLSRLAQVYAAPERQTSLLDVYSIGRALEKAGEGEAARRCFRVASVSELSGKARLQIALSYRRERDYAGAADMYREMIARGDGTEDTYTALAVLLERHLCDAEGALRVTEKALWRFSGRALPEKIDALERRRVRLARRLRRGE